MNSELMERLLTARPPVLMRMLEALPPLSESDFDRLVSEYRPGRAEPTSSRAKTKSPKKPTLVSVAKAANKAAISVARYEVKPDGTVIVHTGTPDSDTKAGNELDEWLAKHAH